MKFEKPPRQSDGEIKVSRKLLEKLQEALMLLETALAPQDERSRYAVSWCAHEDHYGGKDAGGHQSIDEDGGPVLDYDK